MEHFLQKTTSKQDPSQSNYDQQNILQQLEVMQQENFKLLRNVQKLEGKIAYLMSYYITLKNENSQSVNLRIEQIETNSINWRSQLKAYFQKIYQRMTPQTWNRITNQQKSRQQRNQNDAGTAKSMDIFKIMRKILIKKELENLKLWRSISKLYCTPEGLIYSKKMYTGKEILRDIAFAQQRRIAKCLDLNSTEVRFRRSRRVNAVLQDMYFKIMTQKKT